MIRLGYAALTVFVVVAVAVAHAARQAPQTFTVAQGSEIRVPPTWTRSAVTYGNATELVFVRPATAADAREASPDARVLITTEARLNHDDAVKRLADIARERDGKKQFVAINGWPALEMTFVEPLAVRGEQQTPGEPAPATAFVQRGTTAIAADTRIIRFDITLSPGVEVGLLASAQEIARSASFTTKQAPAALQNDMRRLSSTPGLGRTPGVEFIGTAPRATPTRSARTTAAPATGAGAFVQGGVGELEVASSADASHIVVASNVALSFSINGGGSFTTGNGGLFFLNDPSLARGASGNFYLAVIAFPNGSAAHLNQSGCANANSRSTDGGATFNLEGFSTVCPNTGAAMCFPDQEHIAADSMTQSAGTDQLYAVWRNFVPSPTPATCREIQSGTPTTSIACSQDNGQTWTARAAVAGAGDFPRVAVGRDGSVYVVSLSGNSVLLNKFNSCASGLAPVAGFPVTAAFLSGHVSCPVAGLDRCNDGNTLSSPTVAPDPDVTNRIFVAFAERDGSGGERVVITQSSDGGLTFPTRATVSGTVSARRFMPWACSTRGRAFAGWYDRRASAATGAATNDLTDYILGEAKPSIGGTGALSAGFIRKLTTDPDPQCESGWACAAPRSSGDSDACTIQPQLAGFCHGTNTRCDFSTTCSGGRKCDTGLGCPKYGDYNGIACAGDYVIGAWSSATPPSGITAPAGINVFASAEYIGPPPFTCARFPGTCLRPIRFEKDILVLLCSTLPCKVFDPIPRNCLVKWDCPACDPRGHGLCPPYYHIVFDDTLKGWTPSITDANGVAVPHRVYDVAGHRVVSVRPTRAGLVKDGRLADFNLVLTSGPEIKRGVEYKIHARLATSDKPQLEPDGVGPRIP